jgi:predicted adenylyl cyclase CyaB
MYEIEIKAHLDDSILYDLEEKILALTPYKNEKVTYHDIYYDTEKNDFLHKEQELRLRKVDYKNKQKTMITYKTAPFDTETKSKKEYEVFVSNFNIMQDIILNIGFKKVVEYTKECTNYAVKFLDECIIISVVFLPDLSKHFIELEILSEAIDDNITKKLKDILLKLLNQLTIPTNNITSKYYTDYIRKST